MLPPPRAQGKARTHTYPPPSHTLPLLSSKKWTPNDADDAGQRGQHHQHHWRPVSPICDLPVTPGPPKHVLGPGGPRRLVFKNVRADDAGFEEFGSPLKDPSVPWGFAAGTRVSLSLVLEWDVGGPLGEAEAQ